MLRKRMYGATMAARTRPLAGCLMLSLKAGALLWSEFPSLRD